MKRVCLCSLIFSLLYACLVAPAFAQMERISKSPPMGALRDTPAQELILTEEQQATIKRVKANYLTKVVQLRSELAGSQLEFKIMISDPTVNEEAIKVKGREIEAVNGQIVREMINYELEVRKILTPEQLRAWSRTMDVPVQKKWGKNP